MLMGMAAAGKFLTWFGVYVLALGGGSRVAKGVRLRT